MKVAICKSQRRSRTLLVVSAIGLLTGVIACGAESGIADERDVEPGIAGSFGGNGSAGMGPIIGMAGSTGSTPLGSGGTTTCADISVKLTPTIPSVILLVDQSGSMKDDFGGVSRWQAVNTALLAANTGVVSSLEKRVRFGLSLYTSLSGNSGGKCPRLTETAITLSAKAAIQASLAGAAPVKDTPTGESIDAAVAKLSAFKQPGPKAIVLATDGEPDTCADPHGHDAAAQKRSVDAAKQASAKNIDLFVISVGASISKSHLQDVANAGAGLPVGGAKNVPYYQANNQQQLVNAFQSIVNGVRDCVLTVNGTVDASRAGEGTVLLDSTPLAYNDPDGWSLKSPTEVELRGKACDAIQSGDHSISGTFPCDVVTVPR